MSQSLPLQEFISTFPVRQFKKGDMIVCEGLIPRKCYAIKKGFVKVFLPTRNGDEKAVAFNTVNDIIPLAWTFKKAPAPLYYYQSFTDCEVYEMSREDFLTYTQDNPAVFKKLFHYLLDLDIGLKQHIHSLEQAKALDKLLNAFNFLAKRFGEPVSDGKIRMTLPLTQQDLANFLGLTRETTGAQLKDLQTKGIISYQHQQYVIHTKKLLAALEE